MTIEAIRLRCIECGDCLLWQGAKDTSGTPVTRRPGERNFTHVRRRIMELQGVDMGKRLASTVCNRSACVEPTHIALLTRKQLITRAAKVTKYGASPVRSKKLSEAKRKASRLTIEIVQEIRSSGLSSRKVAAKYGISQSNSADILGGRTWRDYSNPFAGLM